MGVASFALISDERQKEAAFITFLVTASGLSLFGIGSAFWGLIIGAPAHFTLQFRQAAPKP